MPQNLRELSRQWFERAWNQRDDMGSLVPAGTYLIRAILLTDRPEGLASPDARVRLER